MVTTVPDLELARSTAASVVDPEIPALTIEDMGILRDVEYEAGGTVIVTITPTYSGCPAMRTIREDIERELVAAGFESIEVRTVLAPAWTTDWMSERGRRMLEASAIAPPSPSTQCPRCRSGDVTEITPFGTTACKALMVCGSCGEPFDRFKEI